MFSRTVLLCLLCIAPFVSYTQDKWHYGAFYGYGAYFNFHKSNSHTMRPSDGSSIGVFLQLDKGEKALGFRTSLARRANDMRFAIADHTELLNNAKSLELKLQCTLPLTSKSTVALGIAPRLVYRSDISIEYTNDANGMHYSAGQSITTSQDSINRLNSCLSISWYYNISSHWSCALNLDQDMLPLYQHDVIFTDGMDNTPLQHPVAINARLTGISASLIFSMR